MNELLLTVKKVGKEINELTGLTFKQVRTCLAIVAVGMVIEVLTVLFIFPILIEMGWH